MTRHRLSSSPRRPSRHFGLAGASLLGAIALSGGAALAGAPAEASPAKLASPPSLVPPLAGSWPADGGEWAELAMGHLGQASDTFWQLFVESTGASRWRLATPPGVADNGGLVSTGTLSSLVVGVEPTNLLTFSPLALTSDGGVHWSQGTLSGGLAAVPDALAASPGGQVLALLGRGGSTLEEEGSGLSSWHTLTTRAAVARSRAGASCGLVRLSAVAVSSSGDHYLGATCDRAGTVGIFASTVSGWHLAGPTLPATVGKATTEVVRLGPAGGGLTALLAARGGTRTVLFGAVRRAEGPWALSAPLTVPPGARLLATGALESGALYVLFRDGSEVGAKLLARQGLGWQGAGWRSLPRPPSGAAVLSGQAGGTLEVLAVDGSKMTDYRLSPGAAHWSSGQRIEVPIQYGSSG